MHKRPITLLAHRGLWRAPEQKNSLAACEAALSSGFGLEVDIRDYDAQLVVAHDVGDPAAYPFSELGRLLERYSEACIAINIKSCGLQSLLRLALEKHNIRRYFLFDMALPDFLTYVQKDFISFTRHSEMEPEPALYEKAQGVWMDMFEREWIEGRDIASHLEKGKEVAIVSPELHGRPHLAFWQRLKEYAGALPKAAGFYLCTDYPEQAEAFFYD